MQQTVVHRMNQYCRIMFHADCYRSLICWVTLKMSCLTVAYCMPDWPVYSVVSHIPNSAVCLKLYFSIFWSVSSAHPVHSDLISAWCIVCAAFHAPHMPSSKSLHCRQLCHRAHRLAVIQEHTVGDLELHFMVSGFSGCC